MIRYLTAGESHGKALTVIIDGVPAGLKLTEEDINIELARRQKGYGRGGRMKIESDKVNILSGVRWGETIGSPVCLMIENKDFVNNAVLMSVLAKDKDVQKMITRPRPGHADLVGIQKFDREDIRDVLERASARETAIRVAAGAVCKVLLAELNIKIFSFVQKIGGVSMPHPDKVDIEQAYSQVEQSELRCPDKTTEKNMIKVIDIARQNGNSVGGTFKIIVKNVPVGLGSYTQWDLRLTSRLAKSICSIPAVKGVEFGCGFEFADKHGSEVMDEIFYDKQTGYYRRTNNSGGIEGGMTNGEDIMIQTVMKPIPSLKKPLKSVDVKTKKPVLGEIIRADICAVPACAVVAESVVAIELANAVGDKFGGDSVKEMKSRVFL
jgi:chorismate synthase